jgi:hypothetical protein
VMLDNAARSLDVFIAAVCHTESRGARVGRPVR